MIGHIVLALILSWACLVGALYLVIYLSAAIAIARHTGIKQFRASWYYPLLTTTGALLLAPVVMPALMFRRWRRRRAFVRDILHAMNCATEVDLTVLPEDEQRTFVHRLRSDEDAFQVLSEAKSRIREVQEAAK